MTNSIAHILMCTLRSPFRQVRRVNECDLIILYFQLLFQRVLILVFAEFVEYFPIFPLYAWPSWRVRSFRIFGHQPHTLHHLFFLLFNDISCSAERSNCSDFLLFPLLCSTPNFSFWRWILIVWMTMTLSGLALRPTIGAFFSVGALSSGMWSKWSRLSNLEWR